jgi:hypothetical protein
MLDSEVASGDYGIPGYNFLTAPYTGSRNDYTGTVGYKFTPTQNIVVSALGRSVSGTMAYNHVVRIWRESDQAVVASATVTHSSPTDALGYKYATLGSSVTLTSGTSYRIASEETSGGDQWMDQASLSNHLSIASVDVACWGSSGQFPSNNQTAGYGYVPPTFYYSVAPTAAAPEFSPAAGAYSAGQSITITSLTGGASIRYTTDGSTPTSSYGTVYSSPVSITQNTTLKAIAYKSGLPDSTVTSGAYSFFVGNNTAGASGQTVGSSTMRACRFLAGANVTASEIQAYVSTSAAGKKIKCAIYSDSSGSPGSFLKGTSELTNPGTGWKTFTLTSSQSLSSGTYYWLVVWANASSYAVLGDSVGGTYAYKSQTYGTWPTSFGTPTGTGTLKYSIYAQ